MEKHSPASDVVAYPVPLLREYHALTDKKLHRTITQTESIRLQEIRCAIAEIDSRQIRPDTWDVQSQKLREELAQIRAEVEALPDTAS